MTHPYLPTQYQQFIHISRYARWLDDEGRRETWEETVNRYFDFFEGHLDKYHGYQLTPELREELSQAILNLEVMPSMRALMTAGPALEREACAGFNCSALPIDSVRSFDELMYILLCGTGVGFSVERQYVSKLPVINEHFENSVTTIVVEDSKAGWARALRELISLLYSGQIPRWDMSRVRPAGARLKTFGGRASGPEPLEDLFKFAVNLFKNAAGRKLTSLEAHDLVCKIGDVVVSGGVRRSALISLSNLSDDRMRHAKSGAWWETHPHRALANNSVAYTDKPDIGIFMDEWKALYDSKSGERGIFNREAARKQVERIGRRDPDHEWLVNPCCVLGDTLLMTTEGPRRIDELEGTPFTALVDGHKYDAPHGSWRSGVGDVYRLSTKEGFVLDLTPEHRILTADRGWVEAKDLKPGDAIVINDHRDIGSWGRIDNFGDGYLLGLSAENKHDIRAFETESSEFYRGFLRGLFDAKGHVEGWKEISTPSGDKGLSVRLGQSNLEFLRSVQRMLLRLGIASRIYDAKEAGFQDSAEKAWRLVIRDNHVRRFAEVVGFTNTVKAQNLQSALQRHKTYNKPFIAHVDTFEYLGRFEVWDAHVDEVHAFDANGIYAHNSEILLRPYQMCNLSEVIVRPDDTVETLKRKVRLAAILGTFQSTLTHYKYLRKVWKNNAEEERLLGVSLTGQLDNELFNGRLGLDKTAEALRELKEVVVATNADLAEKIGIPQSTAVSAVKPAGTTSQLTNTASGMHARHSEYYLRTVRGAKHDPLTQFMIDSGFPVEDDVMKPDTTVVFTFPQKAPEGAITRDQLTAIEHLELWMVYQKNWCEHKASITVSVREHEWLEVGAWVYKNFDEISGVSFLPYTDHSYRQAPYQECSKEEYLEFLKKMPTVDWSLLSEYEKEDNTSGNQTLSCSAGVCEIVDIT